MLAFSRDFASFLAVDNQLLTSGKVFIKPTCLFCERHFGDLRLPLRAFITILGLFLDGLQSVSLL